MEMGLDFDVDLNQLLNLASAVTSPEALTQQAAVCDIIVMLNQSTSKPSVLSSTMPNVPPMPHLFHCTTLHNLLQYPMPQLPQLSQHLLT